jgi:hypothetical protein
MSPCENFPFATLLFLRCATFRSPVNDNNTTFPAGAESVTFVGRPFPLDEAPQHLARLRHWGLTFGELSNFGPCPSPLTYATLPFTGFHRRKSVSSSPGRPWSMTDRMSFNLLLPPTPTDPPAQTHKGDL